MCHTPLPRFICLCVTFHSLEKEIRVLGGENFVCPSRMRGDISPLGLGQSQVRRRTGGEGAV